MSWTIKWVTNKYRRDKRTGVLNPVKPSKYFKYLAGELENGKDDQDESKSD